MSVKICKNITSIIKITARDLVRSTSINQCYKLKQNISNKTNQIYETQYIHLRIIFMPKVKNDRIDTLIPFFVISFRQFFTHKNSLSEIWSFSLSLTVHCKYSNSVFLFSTSIFLGPELSVYTNNNTKCFLKFQNNSWKYLCPIYN